MTEVAKTPRRTTIDGMYASWRMNRSRIEMMFFVVTDSAEPAYRHLKDGSHEPMPACQPGMVSFDPTGYPDLATAREWYPKYSALWDKVQRDLWDALLPKLSNPLNGCTAGRMGPIPQYRESVQSVGISDGNTR